MSKAQKKAYRAKEQEFIKEADVICVTCTYSRCVKLDDHKFPFVLIDEAGQASEPECLIPLSKGAQQAILVGDHKQLRPFSRSFDNPVSLFERKVYSGLEARMLSTQYRMHPDIAEFSSRNFYDGKLLNGVSAVERQLEGRFPSPISTNSTFFWHVPNFEAKIENSYYNQYQACIILHILQTLIENKIDPKNIGVITPYICQKSKIKELNKRNKVVQNIEDVEIATVDSFQGREKEIILISTVRSNNKDQIGFVKDERRMNVMLTRAKRLMIVVGNSYSLKSSEHWETFLRQYHRKNLIFEEGKLGCLEMKTDLFYED